MDRNPVCKISIRRVGLQIVDVGWLTDPADAENSLRTESKLAACLVGIGGIDRVAWLQCREGLEGALADIEWMLDCDV